MNNLAAYIKNIFGSGQIFDILTLVMEEERDCV